MVFLVKTRKIWKDHNMLRDTASLAAIMPLVLAGSTFASSATFTPLGHLPGSQFSQATGISDDGQFVGGHSESPEGFAPIIWDGTTPQLLTLPPGFQDGGAYLNALSGDGQTAVAIGLSMDGFRGIRWDASGTPHILQTGFGTFSSFNAINYDGTATAGFTNQNFMSMESDAVIWTSTGGEQILGDVPGDPHEGSFTAVNDAGTLFGGFGGDGVRRPITWDAVNGFQILPDSAGEPAEGLVIEMSSNGQFIVGALGNQMNLTPAFWADGGNAQAIDLWPGYQVGESTDVVDDGSIVVGNWRLTPFSDEFGSLAFIWDSVNGARPLQEVLEDEYNVDLGGWTLNQVSAISPDGRALAGTGVNPQGNLEAYKVLLPDVATPLGDLNGDGVVDVSDLLLLLAAWGPCPPEESCDADLNNDGSVDVSDLLLLLGNWG